MIYSEQLKTKEWIKFRKEILKRDRYKCQNCKGDNIILSSYPGIILSVDRKLSLLGMINRSDPRFNFSYEVHFKTMENKNKSEHIYSFLNLKDEELEKFKDNQLSYIINARSNFEGTDIIKDYQITLIENYTDINSWFYCKELHVHHINYLKGKKAWDYPKNNLTTLCWICHEDEHK